MNLLSTPLRFRTRPLGVVVAALAIVGVTYAAVSAGRVVGPPPAPAGLHGGDGAPSRLAATATAPGITVATIDASLHTWSAKAAADVNDYISATNVGVLYLGRARLTFDLGDYERAAAAAARALAADPAYMPARALEATIRFATHDFAGALDAARAILATAPSDPDALAVVGDASLEMGDLDTTRETYARLTILTPGPALDVRLARLAYVSGDPDRALEIARRARADAVASGSADPAFFEFQLGEFARLAGDAATARTGYEAAIAGRPNHVGALVGLARVEAAAGHADQAVEALRRAVAIAPQPEALAILGDLLAARGDSADATTQYDTVRLTARLSALAGSVYDRQLIAFELDHGGSSSATLDAARESVAARPDASGHDLLAWAFHRLGRDGDALVESDRARSAGIVDGRFLFHAGAIRVTLGDATSGRTLLREALALGPALDPADRAAAERLLAARESG